MKIVEVKENKRQYLDLLLLADEQEDMVDRYLDKGKMYVLDDNGVKCECGLVIIVSHGNSLHSPQKFSFFSFTQSRVKQYLLRLICLPHSPSSLSFPPLDKYTLNYYVT